MKPRATSKSKSRSESLQILARDGIADRKAAVFSVEGLTTVGPFGASVAVSESSELARRFHGSPLDVVEIIRDLDRHDVPNAAPVVFVEHGRRDLVGRDAAELGIAKQIAQRLDRRERRPTRRRACERAA
jgi:hypothetical protein